MNGPDIPKINEGITRRFRKIEARLALGRSAVELFEALLADIQTEFSIPFVWLSLIYIPELAGLQKNLEASPLLRDRLNIIENALFLEVVPDGAPPLLVSGDLRPFFRLLPPNRKYFIRSIAVSPLTFHGRLIGSLNQGDSSPERYAPGMDTALLMHLAQRVSERLSHLLPSEEQSGHPALSER
jgi:two-component system, cell cycle response regulator